ENRKRDFLSKMGAWRTRVYRCVIASKLSANFPDEIASFGGDYVAMERDFTGETRDKFHSLCDQLVGMTDAEVEEVPAGDLVGKSKLLERIESIISLVEKTS